MIKALFSLHRHLFYRLAAVDLLLVLVGQIYVFGKGESFQFLPNLAYLLTLFLLFVSLNVAFLRRFSGGGQFYLNLPISKATVITQFLLVRLGFIVAVLFIVTGVAAFILPGDNAAHVVMNAVELLVFSGMIGLTTLPITILQGKEQPVGLFMVVGYLLTFIPVWVVTTILDELLFSSLPGRPVWNALVFLLMSFWIAGKVVRTAKV